VDDTREFVSPLLDETTTETCRTCGQSKEWHEDNLPQHGFDASGASLNASASDQSRNESEASDGQGMTRRDRIVRALGHDEPLRGVLIQKGILTPEELGSMTDFLVGVWERSETGEA
jgi:hypothetical protein